MNCPRCNARNELEAVKCSECGAELKAGSFIKVLETGDKPLITITKSVLTDADVEYFVKGEDLQDIIGLGSFGIGYNFAAGPMELYVHEEDAEAVKMLIDELEESQAVEEIDEEDSEF